MSPLETEFQSHLLAALNAPRRSTRAWRINSGVFVKRDRRGKVVGAIHGAPEGAADLCGFVRPEGWLLQIEVKGPKTPHTDEQKRWGANIRAGGGIYVVVRYDAREGLSTNVLAGVAIVDDVITLRRIEVLRGRPSTPEAEESSPHAQAAEASPT